MCSAETSQGEPASKADDIHMLEETIEAEETKNQTEKSTSEEQHVKDQSTGGDDSAENKELRVKTCTK